MEMRKALRIIKSYIMWVYYGLNFSYGWRISEFYLIENLYSSAERVREVKEWQKNKVCVKEERVPPSSFDSASSEMFHYYLWLCNNGRDLESSQGLRVE